MNTATQPAVVTFARTPYSVELRDVPIPSIGDHDVLLEVAAVGVCGSDLHMSCAAIEARLSSKSDSPISQVNLAAGAAGELFVMRDHNDRQAFSI